MDAFPLDVQFGVATSAYQVEGATCEGGRGTSIWDDFSLRAGAVRGGDTGAAACDHYHRYPEDIKLMQELGVQVYRFSIAWPRIFPTGKGALNQAGVDFYKRLVDNLLRADISPLATLYHWDLPQALQTTGGWSNRDTAFAFADYAQAVFAQLGDVIPRFVTVNEPWCSTVFGHLTGEHAPGVRHLPSALAVGHHLLLGHGLAVQAFRATAPAHGEIGITNVLSAITAASAGAQDLAASARVDALLNRWFLDPLFRATYPAELSAVGLGDPIVRQGDMEVIAQPLDFLGVNYYQRHVVEANPDDPLFGATLLPPRGAQTAMGWGIDPDGLRDVLLRVWREYKPQRIWVTENGASFADSLVSGKVHDCARIDFLRGHTQALLAAITAGVPVQGYCLWSLLDNFEWAHGYGQRFGIVHVNFDTQVRTPKDSYYWYQRLIATRQPPGTV